MNKEVLSKVFFILMVVLFPFSLMAKEPDCTTKRSLNFSIVEDREGISISRDVQKFISIHALVNPEVIFYSTQVNGTTLYQPFNGLVFKNIEADMAYKIYESSKGSKTFSLYKTFIRNSVADDDTLKDILVGNGYDLKGLCSLNFIEASINGGTCRWKDD